LTEIDFPQIGIDGKIHISSLHDSRCRFSAARHGTRDTPAGPFCIEQRPDGPDLLMPEEAHGRIRAPDIPVLILFADISVSQEQ
jgi:hypothetical protein